MSQNQIIKLRGEKTYEKNKSKCVSNKKHEL